MFLCTNDLLYSFIASKPVGKLGIPALGPAAIILIQQSVLYLFSNIHIIPLLSDAVHNGRKVTSRNLGTYFLYRVLYYY